MVKRLRNDAAPTPGSPQGIDRATAEDLIFQSADPHPPAGASDNAHNVMRVRYCLDGSDPANQKIWVQQQRWTSAVAPAAAASSSCPDPGWGDQHVIADNVVNNLAQSPRAVWTIDCPAGYSAAVCAAGSDLGMLAKVKRIAIEIFVDRNPGEAPSESRLSTAVYFRNQNARPTAVLTPAAVQPVGGHVLANASASSDPDADRLSYRWCYYGTNTPSSTWCANGIEIAQRTVAVDHIANPAPAPGTTVRMGLRVQDPGRPRRLRHRGGDGSVNRVRMLARETGSALVAATLVMTLTLTLGLATLATVDTQTQQSSVERTRESAFNWSEGVLNAKTFTVANAWPASADSALADCAWAHGASSTTSSGVNACPTAALISSTFDGNVDVEQGAEWVTNVRDNAGTHQCEDTANANCSYTWDEDTSLAAPHWDANQDDLLWLRADGTVNGDRRVVVALVRIQHDPVTMPQSVIVAGSLSVSGGNKTFIHQNGSSIALRCGPVTDPSCFSEQKPENVQGPGAITPNYTDYAVDEDDGQQHILTQDEMDAMRTRAEQLDRYYPPGQCPTSAAGFTGEIVFIEDVTECRINSGWQINKPPLKPGLLIVNRGTLRFNGNADFWGLIYMYNDQGWDGDDDPLFDGIGNGNLHGALFVDGEGKVDNSGSFTLQYDANAINGITAYGATGIVPNSFREVNP